MRIGRPIPIMQGQIRIDLAKRCFKAVHEFTVPRQESRAVVNVRVRVNFILLEPAADPAGGDIASSARIVLCMQRNDRVAQAFRSFCETLVTFLRIPSPNAICVLLLTRISIWASWIKRVYTNMILFEPANVFMYFRLFYRLRALSAAVGDTAWQNRCQPL